MYRWMRNVHLVLGLASLPMLMMYAISAIGMSHPAWFTGKPQVSDRVVQLTLSPEENDGRALARELMRQFGLRGELNTVEPTPAGYHLEIGRVGTSYAIDYSQQAGEARIRTTTAKFMGMLGHLHHISGFRTPSVAVDILGVFVLLVSIGLILLGLSGIYLWFQFNRERRIGALLLALSLGYSLTLMILIRIA